MDSYPFHMRIIWAVDPNERGDSELHQRARKVLRRLLSISSDSVIEPVYVLRVSTAVAADVGKKWRDELIAPAEESLRAFVAEAGLPGLGPPKVLVSGASSYRSAATLLADHASRVGADVIVAQTHGRTGLGRMVLGSFAETLMLTARTPVLLVNPRSMIQPTFGNILFPTDFGISAASQLREVMDLATAYGAKVTLFHALETEEKAVMLSSVMGPAPILPSREVRAERARKHARHWIEIANHHGVAMDFILRSHARSPGDAILSTARKTEAGLIAMQTNSGAFSAALLGSTARQVVRKSPCPVWILKPQVRRLNERMKGVRPKSSPPPEAFTVL